MDAEAATKIDAGVNTCLELAKATDQPFTAVSRFIESLSADPKWAPAEIIELQTRVIRVMMYKAKPGGEPG